MNTDLHRVRVLIGEFELVRSVNRGVEFNRFHRRAGEASGFRTITTILHRLRLKTAAQSLRVVLQRDDAQRRRVVRVNKHDAGFEQTGGVGEGGHCLLNILNLVDRSWMYDLGGKQKIETAANDSIFVHVALTTHFRNAPPCWLTRHSVRLALPCLPLRRP